MRRPYIHSSYTRECHTFCTSIVAPLEYCILAAVVLGAAVWEAFA